MTIGNRGLSGQPTLPYTDYRSYAGADIFIDLTFLDHTLSQVAPTTITYRIDDITNDIGMVPSTSVTPNGTSQITLQIPGSTLLMTYPYQGSQLCQIIVTATVTDTVTLKPSQITTVGVLELIAIQTPT